MWGWHTVSHPWLWTILVLGLVGAVVFLIARAVTSRSIDRQGRTGSRSMAPSALEILREHFARGEIGIAEFETAKRALGYPSAQPDPTLPATPPPPAPPSVPPPPSG
jgi:uncharacterized membrane protein